MFDTSLLELWPWIVSGGFLVGFLVGMTGVGAGSLMTPFLITNIGIPAPIAVGTDLLFAALTKATAVIPHHSLGNVNWPIVRWLALGSIPGALMVLATLHVLEPDTDAMSRVIKIALMITLFVSSVAILVYPYVTRAADANASTSDETPVRRLSTIMLGLLLGSIVTLTSVGAGAIGVVILTLLYPTLQTRRLIGSDIVHAIPLTLISGLGHFSMGNTNLGLLGLLLIGSVPGIALGARLTGKLPDWVLRTALAAILAFAAYQLSQKI